jgi:hypothetical protein
VHAPVLEEVHAPADRVDSLDLGDVMRRTHSLYQAGPSRRVLGGLAYALWFATGFGAATTV